MLWLISNIYHIERRLLGINYKSCSWTMLLANSFNISSIS